MIPPKPGLSSKTFLTGLADRGLIAAFLGFGGLAGTAVDIAKILFFVFLVLFVVSGVMHLVRGRAP